jgi:hypothetical protein
VHSLYANIFGPPMYPELQEKLARQYFEAFFANHIQVCELRTQLGVPGMEMKGPQLAAQELLKAIRGKSDVKREPQTADSR